jgi:catechol 2,3-dioxygenase-like lactoylglutathione lyase family enzyme
MIDHLSIGVRDVAKAKRFYARHSSRSVIAA